MCFVRDGRAKHLLYTCDTTTAAFDFEANVLVCETGSKRQLLRSLKSIDGFAGVHQQIEEHLLNLGGIRECDWEVRA